MKSARLRCLAAACALLSLIACGGGDGGAEEESDIAERNVRFETSDGLTLTGRLFGTGRVGVTLAHAAPKDAESWYPHARTIAEAGYMALAFNFRGFGDSEGIQTSSKANVDVEAARDYLEEAGARDFAFVGASMGGTASLVAAEDLDPLAVVAISAPMSFGGLDAAPIAGRVARPVLLMWSSGDQSAAEAVEQLERALPNADTRGFDGDAHGTDLLEAKPEAVDEIVDFLERYVPTTIPGPSAEA